MNIGEHWNGWTIEDFIGEGSFGKVYKIKREEFGYTYYSALKVLRIPQNKAEVTAAKHDGMSEKSITTYFQSMVEDIVSEFAMMSQLRGNSNIVSFEDHQVDKLEDDFGWEIYIRMELLTPLFDYLQDNTLTIRDVIKMGIDMCKALEICQKYNIIHRDIKPENIFISNQGNYKLGDFGIARQLEKTTAGLSKKGTLSYMAPEVYKGQPYNSTVDIYSLGIVLYRFLNNNRMPFLPPYPEQIHYSDKERANFMRMSGEAFDPPCNAKGRLAEIVMKACAYNPKERYESAHEMRRELEAIAYSEEESRIIYPAGDSLGRMDRSVTETTKGTEVSEQDKTVSMFDLTPEEKAEAEEQARKEAEEKARREAEERARKEAEEKARREAEERARKEAEEKARREAEERARKEAEEKAKREAEERARKEAEEKAKREAEERARKEAEEKARREAEERARKEAEEKARREAEERARKEAEEKARREAEERARKEAEEKAKREAEERARKEAEEKARREAEERARKEVEEKARRKEEERARKEAEKQAKKEAKEKAKREAEERARKEAEERAKREAEERARKEAEEKARKEAKEKAKREAEERARKEAEEKAKREAEERAQKEAEAKARREAEQKARLEAEAKARKEAEEKAQKEAEAKARREADKKAKLEAKAKAKKEAEEQKRQKVEEKKQKREEKQKNASEGKSNSLTKKPIFWVVAAVLAAALCITPVLYHYYHHEVPDVVGMEASKAETSLQDSGLKYKEADHVFSDKADRGTVISQSIEKGEKVKKGTPVNVVISKGVAIKTPDLKGKSKEDAEKKAKEKDLTIKVTGEEYSDDIKKGAVKKQTPEKDSKVEAETVIEVILSKGIEQVEVPDVVGKSQEDAEKALKEAKLESSISNEYSGSVEYGKVISQSEEAGDKIDKNSTVTISVSIGPAPVYHSSGGSSKKKKKKSSGGGGDGGTEF